MRVSQVRSTEERLRYVEHVLARFRWLLAAFGIVSTVLDPKADVLRWTALLVFVASCAIATLALRFPLNKTQLRILGAVVVGADMLLVMSAMFTDTSQIERGIFLAGVLVIFEGAVRWMITGGVLTAVALDLAMLAWMERRDAIGSVRFDVPAFAFRSAILIALGFAIGVLVRALETARDELAQRSSESEIINKFALEAPRLSEQAAVRLLAGLLHDELGYKKVGILLYDPTAGVLRSAAAGFSTDVEDVMGAADAGLDGIPVGHESRSIAARCFRTGRSQVVVDVISDPDYLMVDPSVRSQLHVLLRAGSRRLGVIVVSSDVTDGFSDNDARLLERAAGELAQVLEHARLGKVQRETINDLQRLSTMKDDFIAITSHELRTPLTAMRGFAGALERRRGDMSAEQEENAIRAISRQVDRMNTLTEDLLAVSLIDSGRSSPTFELVDVAAIAHEVATDLDPHDGVHRLSVSIPDTLPSAAADPSFLRRVLVNLISNAVRYSPAGGTVNVDGRLDEKSICIEVRDQGVGIAAAEVEQLFGKFVRVGSTRAIGGTGLGLFIVKGLVEAMDGEVTVESTPGEGSCFAFTLPIAHTVSSSTSSDGASPPTDGPRDGRVPGSASRAGGSLR